MKHTIDEPKGFIERVRPLYDGLFHCAYAATGNLELAEFVLRRGLLEAYLRRHEWRERMGFHEGLVYTLSAIALAELKQIRAVGGYDLDWTFPDAPELTPDEQALYSRMEGESPRVQRLMLLTYGCGMKQTQVAEALNMSAAGVREVQRRLTARFQRAARVTRREMDRRIEALCDKLLNVPCPDAPACGTLLRAFERDAHEASERRPSAGRAIGAFFLVVGAILCAGLFWILTILLEPQSVTVSPSAAPEAEVFTVDDSENGSFPSDPV